MNREEDALPVVRQVRRTSCGCRGFGTEDQSIFTIWHLVPDVRLVQGSGLTTSPSMQEGNSSAPTYVVLFSVGGGQLLFSVDGVGVPLPSSRCACAKRARIPPPLWFYYIEMSKTTSFRGGGGQSEAFLNLLVFGIL